MAFIHLPCIKCGAALPITRGSLVQCFACGTKNAFMESFDEISKFAMDIIEFPIKSEEIELKVPEQQVYQRMNKIDEKFNEFLSQSRQIEYLIISKLDQFQIEIDIEKLGKSIGKLGILIEFYLIPHLKNTLQQKQYWELRQLCKIRNILLNALAITNQAKKEFPDEPAKELYLAARKNYVKAQEFAAEINQKGNLPDFEEERKLSQGAEQFCILLEDFLTANPGYYADQLENIENLLKEFTDSRAVILKKQILRFYNLGTEIMFILEDLRNKKPLLKIHPSEERVLYFTREIKDDLKGAREWILSFETRFTTTQKDLMALHGGQLMPYLEDYRKEYQLRLNDVAQYFNDVLSQYVTATLSDYTIETSDNFELLDALLDNEEFDAERFVEKVENFYHELLVLNETVRQFVYSVLDNAIKENLHDYHNLEMVTAVAEKNAQFDKKILRFITLLNERFIEYRNKHQLPLDKQRVIFNTQYRPLIDRIMKSTFVIKREEIAYPMFMEYILLDRHMDVEKEYPAIILLENSSPNTLRGVGVSFFVPNSFQIQTRVVEIGKMRSGEKLRIETRIVPTKDGYFTLMAMVQYEQVNESYWTPTIKIPIKVGNPPDEDTYLKDYYQKHGVDPETVAEAKQMDQPEPELPEDEAPDTVEKINLANLLKDFALFEEKEKEDEKEEKQDKQKAEEKN